MMGFAWIGWIITTVMIGYMGVIIASLWSREMKIEWTKPLEDVVEAQKAKDAALAEKGAEI